MTNASVTNTHYNTISFASAPSPYNSLPGSITDYATSSLSSSAVIDLSGYDVTTSKADAFVETFTNNTGRTLTSLTITLSSATGSPTFTTAVPSAPAIVGISGTLTGPSALPIVTDTVPQPGSFLITNIGKSITFSSPTGLANGQSFSFVAPIVFTTNTSPGSLTLMETAIPTPEPSTLLMGVSAAGLSLLIHTLRRRRGSHLQTV